MAMLPCDRLLIAALVLAEYWPAAGCGDFVVLRLQLNFLEHHGLAASLLVESCAVHTFCPLAKGSLRVCGLSLVTF